MILEGKLMVTCDIHKEDNLQLFLDSENDTQLAIVEDGLKARIVLSKDKALKLANTIIEMYK